MILVLHKELQIWQKHTRDLQRKIPMSKNQKRKSKRARAKYPALIRELNLKGRRYYIETDYINGVGRIRALTEREKAFLNRFYEEYINAKFDKEHPRKNLHTTKKKRRELYRENNDRNFCLYNLKQKTGQLDSFNANYYDKFSSETYGHLDFEESMTNELEAKEIAVVIIELIEKLNKTPFELSEIIKSRFPEYFYRNFSEKELKKMKKSEPGETLYIEAKMLLE